MIVVLKLLLQVLFEILYPMKLHIKKLYISYSMLGLEAGLSMSMWASFGRRTKMQNYESVTNPLLH